MTSMQTAFWVIAMLVAMALLFDFMNGFHDAANSIATVVSTGVLKPTQAVVFAAFFNFVAIFIFHLSVAATVGKGIAQPGEADDLPLLVERHAVDVVDQRVGGSGAQIGLARLKHRQALAARGLRTMGVRLEAQTRSALRIASSSAASSSGYCSAAIGSTHRSRAARGGPAKSSVWWTISRGVAFMGKGGPGIIWNSGTLETEGKRDLLPAFLSSRFVFQGLLKVQP